MKLISGYYRTNKNHINKYWKLGVCLADSIREIENSSSHVPQMDTIMKSIKFNVMIDLPACSDYYIVDDGIFTNMGSKENLKKQFNNYKFNNTFEDMLK